MLIFGDLRHGSLDDDTRLQGYEAHIQASQSEAGEQARLSGANEDSRGAEGPGAAAGARTRSSSGEDRLEVTA